MKRSREETEREALYLAEEHTRWRDEAERLKGGLPRYLRDGTREWLIRSAAAKAGRALGELRKLVRR